MTSPTPQEPKEQPMQGLSKKKERLPPLSPAYIAKRLRVDVMAGKAYWIDPTRFHRRLIGCEAGGARFDSRGKGYWYIKLGESAYMRSMIIFAVMTGRWPEHCIDHISGDSLDDRAENLRAATQTQNAWNHKTRAKKSSLPMGVRELSSGFQARIQVNKQILYLGVYSTQEEASGVYLRARTQHFGEFA